MCYSYVCTDNLFDVKELDLTVVAKGYIVTFTFWSSIGLLADSSKIIERAKLRSIIFG